MSNVVRFPSNGRRTSEAGDVTDDGSAADVEPDLRSAVGDELRIERHAQERSLGDVADGAGVSLPYLSEIERGRKDASAQVIESVCRSLELPVPVLLERVADRLRVGAQGATRVELLAA